MKKDKKYVIQGIALVLLGAISYYAYKYYEKETQQVNQQVNQIPFTVEQFWAHETCQGYCGGAFGGNGMDYIYQVYIKLSEPVNGYGIVYITIDNNIHAAPINIVNGEGTAYFDEDNAIFNHIYFYWYRKYRL